jgi:hypothetical protein
MARRLGLQSHHERCHSCPEPERCPFFLDLAASPELSRLYVNAENADHYFRDQCVFRPDIDIEDTMSVIVEYDTSARLSYSLNAFCAWEGYEVSFNGTKGRLEHQLIEQSYVSGTSAVQGATLNGGVSIRIIPTRGPSRSVIPWTGPGDHGGGDTAMLADIFDPHAPPDKYLRAADERSGAASILVGVAANLSMQSKGRVVVRDLVSSLHKPDYTPMPGPGDIVSLPLRVGMARAQISSNPLA